MPNVCKCRTELWSFFFSFWEKFALVKLDWIKVKVQSGVLLIPVVPVLVRPGIISVGPVWAAQRDPTSRKQKNKQKKGKSAAYNSMWRAHVATALSTCESQASGHPGPFA
jgi:hypothetical protein